MVLLPQIPLGEEKVVTTSLTSVLNFLVNKYLITNTQLSENS